MSYSLSRALCLGGAVALCLAALVACSDDSAGTTPGDAAPDAADAVDDALPDLEEDPAGGDTEGPDADAAPDAPDLADAADLMDLQVDSPGHDTQTHVDAPEPPDPCVRCHGLGNDPAPPLDSRGNLSETERGVGAHQAHLQTDSTWHAVTPCTECHVVPEFVGSPGHIDDELPAELVFGPLATADGADGGWDGERCTNAYCHGATLNPGGSLTAPTWTTVDGTQAECGACHGTPPPPPHPASTACGMCHPTIDPGSGDPGSGDPGSGEPGSEDAWTFLLPNQHIDGLLQVEGVHPLGWAEPTQHGAAFNAGGADDCSDCHGAALDGGTSGVSCNSCHDGWQFDCLFCHGGMDNTTGAPPWGVDGESVRTVLPVGAHTSHVETTSMHLAFDCSRCHLTPDDALSAGHIDGEGGDGRAEVVFDALNPSGAYDGEGTCQSLYCHGNGQTPDDSPLWTGDIGLGCSSCHANQSGGAGFDLSGEHDLHVLSERFTCSECHDATANGNMINDPAPHVDGDPDVDFATGVNITRDASGRCNGDCHGEEHEDDTW